MRKYELKRRITLAVSEFRLQPIFFTQDAAPEEAC